LKKYFISPIHAQDNYAVCWASFYGHSAVVQFLCENGANICMQNHLIIRRVANCYCIEMVKYLLNQYENDDSLIYLLNELYHLQLNFDKNLTNKIDVLIWSIKLNKYSYFKDHFNEEYEIYDFIFNYKFSGEFNKFVKNKKHLRNTYIKLETICEKY